MFYVILDDLNYLLNNHLHDIMSHPILFVHDGVRRQNFQRLDPAGVHRLVFGGRDRKELRERYPEGDRNVGPLLRMHPFSTARIGNLLSNVAVFSMLRIVSPEIKGETERKGGQAAGVHPCGGRSVGACACGPPP